MSSKTPDMAALVEHYWERPATPAEQTIMRGEVKRHSARIGKRATPHDNRMFDIEPEVFARILAREAD